MRDIPRSSDRGPGQATTCSAQDPTVELVLCDVVWDTVAPLTCNVELWCD